MCRHNFPQSSATIVLCPSTWNETEQGLLLRMSVEVFVPYPIFDYCFFNSSENWCNWHLFSFSLTAHCSKVSFGMSRRNLSYGYPEFETFHCPENAMFPNKLLFCVWSVWKKSKVNMWKHSLLYYIILCFMRITLSFYFNANTEKS